jgi:ligand-binding sensor domain-containing protein
MLFKKPLFKLLLLTQFLFAGVYASTPYQVVYLKNYSPSDGLPGSQINYLMQDSKGFIWIATDKGVSRFDGQRFKNLPPPMGLKVTRLFVLPKTIITGFFFTAVTTGFAITKMGLSINWLQLKKFWYNHLQSCFLIVTMSFV